MHPSFSTQRILALAATGILVAGSACGGEGGTNPPTPVITTIVKQVTTDGQTATVADEVPNAPSVIVRDQNGNPMAGVTVSFTVATGGGEVTGGTPVTSASGVATAGAWTLGTTAGANSLTASAGGKSVTFTATGTAGAASNVMRVTGTDGQSATAGSAVPLDPAIRVTDGYDNPIAGVAVTFAVASGGGSVTGATQTTDATGVATVGSWTLGSSLGPNELNATVTGLPEVTFTATATAGAAAAMDPIPSTDGQEATVGTTVANPPAVIVVDANGNPVTGATVTFAVTSGGGSVTGATATTDADGIATVGSWTLGTTAGENRLTATTSGLAPVPFTATGTPAAAASLTKVPGTDEQIGSAGKALPLDPSVVVVDAYGNPVRDVTVTFAVASGGGSVTDATQASDTSGVATVGSWTLGPYNELNELTASATGLTSVTFQAAPDPCTVEPPLAIGGSFAGELTDADCVASDGTFIDYYTVQMPSAGALELTLSSSAFDAYLYLFDPEGLTRAFGNDIAGSTNAAVKVLMPSGSYWAGANTWSPGERGAYTIAATAVSADVTGCKAPWVVRGISTSQSLATTDCVNSAGPWYSDELYVYLRAGESVTVTMSSTAVNAHLVLFDGSGTYITEDDDGAGGTNARITYTATTSGTYIIKAGAYTAQTGAYTLEIQ